MLNLFKKFSCFLPDFLDNQFPGFGNVCRSASWFSQGFSDSKRSMMVFSRFHKACMFCRVIPLHQLQGRFLLFRFGWRFEVFGRSLPSFDFDWFLQWYFSYSCFDICWLNSQWVNWGDCLKFVVIKFYHK